MKQVLVVSHADADGHVIAEQVRRNLDAVPSFDVSVVVDPERTKNHRTWTKLDALPEIERASIVFFVDLMFAPASFATEATSLVEFAKARPDKRFFVLDHHPLPIRLLSQAGNVRALYRRDVVDCTFGNPSWMMCIAALLEKQPTRATEFVQPIHKELAQGIRRAAAPGGPLAGDPLLALLHFGCWNELIALGRDDAENHYLPRGRRPSRWKPSEPMSSLVRLAGELLGSGKRAKTPLARKAKHVSYDFDVEPNCIPPKIPLDVHRPSPSQGTDLEAIVTLLELAAISLTSEPGDQFTAAQLLDEARTIGGNDVTLDDVDVMIVLDKAAFLAKQKQKKYSLR